MTLQYEIGDPEKPRGHALVYFTRAGEQDSVLATYIVVLPSSVDVTKYMPPILAPQVTAGATTNLSSFAFPPVPEEFESHLSIQQVASSRGDDLLNGGAMISEDMAELLAKVNGLVEEYSAAYSSYINSIGEDRLGDHAYTTFPTDTLQVTDVLYEFMDLQQKLGELTSMLSKMRLAVESEDDVLLQECRAEVFILSKYVPKEFQLDRIADLAVIRSDEAQKLIQAYVDRCYKLVQEDYLGLQEVDEYIASLENS
tara:strand:- start:1401 stop:2165 length:765 start_codon:yes stop_codon:yes gene_type:complete